MADHTIKLSTLSAMNVRSLVEDRLNQINKLAVQFPDLPMRDPITIASYQDVLDELNRVINGAIS